MSDTSLQLEARYRAMLLAKTPAERVEMVGDMFAAARAMMIAGLTDRFGQLSASDLRVRLFLQLYGSELDEARRAAIVGILRTGASPSVEADT